jgi:hypothetical protein
LSLEPILLGSVGRVWGCVVGNGFEGVSSVVCWGVWSVMGLMVCRQSCVGVCRRVGCGFEGQSKYLRMGLAKNEMG